MKRLKWARRFCADRCVGEEQIHQQGFAAPHIAPDIKPLGCRRLRMPPDSPSPVLRNSQKPRFSPSALGQLAQLAGGVGLGAHRLAARLWPGRHHKAACYRPARARVAGGDIGMQRFQHAPVQRDHALAGLGGESRQDAPRIRDFLRRWAKRPGWRLRSGRDGSALLPSKPKSRAMGRRAANPSAASISLYMPSSTAMPCGARRQDASGDIAVYRLARSPRWRPCMA